MTPSTPAAPIPTPATPVSTPTPAAPEAQSEEAPVADEGETPEESEVQGESEAGGAEDETTPVATASPGPTPEASSGELPFTGMNAWWIGALGLTAAGTGLVLRRRSTG